MNDHIGLFSFFFIPDTVEIKQLLQAWWDESGLREGLTAVSLTVLLRLTDELPNMRVIVLFLFQK